MKSAAVPMLVLLAWIVPAVAGQSAPAQTSAPASAETSDAPVFTDEQLEQIAAPVALHPDSLLAQIFMASTYPLEVVEADRWLKKEKPKPDKLDELLKEQEWDQTVKALCSLPDVLSRMSENLDWTRDMGDAFLGQREGLFDAVQRLRGKAKASGNLETTKEQTVTVENDNIIVIESSNPDVVYVPSYSPTVVYGGWSYPSYHYPPLYAPVAPGYGLLAFGAGMAVGAAIWGDCDWGNNDCNINVERNNNFNRNTNRNFERNESKQWNHDSSHRKGVNYRDNKTAQKFGGSEQGNRVSNNDARGRGSASDRARGSGSRDSASSRDRSASNRGSGGASNRDGGNKSAKGGNKSKGGGMSGSRNPGLDKSASSRGKSSRSSASSRSGSRGGGYSSGGRGGGSRGGGGGRGGGGRGGGGRR